MSSTGQWFRLRRLGHANLFIGEYERSLHFYRDVVGLWDGWTRPTIGGGFLNNGSSHHDIGFIPWNSSVRRIEASGPGLNHLAFEVQSEAALVEGYRAARRSGYEFIATVDHLVARSLYCRDPDGIQLEIEADTGLNFGDQDFLRLQRASVKWDPETIENPDPKPYYVDNHQPKLVDHTVFHATKIDGATLVSANFDETVRFYQERMGMTLVGERPEKDFAVLRGSAEGRHIVLHRARDGLELGMHHISFPVFSVEDLEASASRAVKEGVKIVKEIDHPLQRAFMLADPDGIRVKMFADKRSIGADEVRSLSPEDALWVL